MSTKQEILLAESELKNESIKQDSEVYYIGSKFSLQRLCGVRKMTVISIDGDAAEVKAQC
ncbi:MAG: hypothetical protein AAGB19_00390 [Cyanobacteria bacterium P01_F01_bin.3]